MITVFKNADPMIAIVILCMLGLGLLGVLSAGMHLNQNPLFFFQRQLIFIIAGLILMLTASKIDYRIYRFKAVYVYMFSVVLLLIVLLYSSNQSWIPIWFFHLQPSEPAKLMIILYLSYITSFDRDGKLSFWNHSVPIMFTCATLIIPTALQPDFGTAMVMTIITAYTMLIGAIPLAHLLMPAALGIPFAVAIPVLFPHVMQRFINFLQGLTQGSDPFQLSYHDLQFHLAMGSGGLFGTGFGNGLIKRSFLPASHTDSIYAVLVEEGGFFTGMAIVFLFLALFLLGERTARYASDHFGAMLARGITFYITVQAFLNISVCLGLFPNTGVTLPFFSYGGSSMLISLFAIGVLINISSQRQLIC